MLQHLDGPENDREVVHAKFALGTDGWNPLIAFSPGHSFFRQEHIRG